MEKSASKTVAEKPKAGKLRRKIVLATSAATAGLVLVTVILAALLFTSMPKYQYRLPEIQDYIVQSRVIAAICKSVSGKKIASECELILSPDEVNSLWRCAEFADLLVRPERRNNSSLLRDFHLSYENGVWQGEFPFDTQERWCFGGVILLRFVCRVEVIDHNLQFTVISAKAGAIPIPASWCNHYVEERLPQLAAKPEYQLISDAIIGIQADRVGNLVCRYIPIRLQPIVRNLR